VRISTLVTDFYTFRLYTHCSPSWTDTQQYANAFQSRQKKQKVEEAMAAATPKIEKEAAEKHKLNELWRTETNPSTVTKVGADSKLPPTVVSPPSALNFNSLLTGHVGQEGGMLLATDTTMTALVTETQAKDTVKSPKKKKSKKVKSTSKGDKFTKHDRSGSVLKNSTLATSTPNASTSAKE
jgi:hypothetical protein